MARGFWANCDFLFPEPKDLTKSKPSIQVQAQRTRAEERLVKLPGPSGGEHHEHQLACFGSTWPAFGLHRLAASSFFVHRGARCPSDGQNQRTGKRAS